MEFSEDVEDSIPDIEGFEDEGEVESFEDEEDGLPDVDFVVDENAEDDEESGEKKAS